METGSGCFRRWAAVDVKAGDMAEDLSSRYARNRETLSLEDQERLGRQRVAVLGLGGLGGGVCEMLARVGVGYLTLVDGDRFEASNLNRQLLSREDILGQSKAEAAAQRVAAVNSQVRVQTFDTFAGADTIGTMIEGADLLIDCLDAIDDRFMAQDAAQAAGIPLVSGAIAGSSGQVTVILPGDRGFELIYGPRSREGRPEKGVEQITGNLAPTAMFVAALQVSECIKVLLGRENILVNRLLVADLFQNSYEMIELV